MKDRASRAFEDVTEQRRKTMAAVKGSNTSPELKLRSMLHRLGYRFTIRGRHNKLLPGKPDIVLPGRRTVIFVHGCFWHGHEACNKFQPPRTRTEYWVEKINRNKLRDKASEIKLYEMGWTVLVVWECELRSKNIDNTEKTLKDSIPDLVS